MLADAHQWGRLPPPVATGWSCSSERSAIPGRDEVLIETFARAQPALSRRLSVRGTARPSDARHAADAAARSRRRRAARLRRQRLRHGRVGARRSLGAHRRRQARPCRSLRRRTCWATISTRGSPKSNLMKRTFRQVALIAGLVERRHRGAKRPAGRSRCRPTSSTTCCAATIRTTFCWKRRGPTRPQAFWISRDSGISCAASTVKSGINRLDRVSPLSVPILLEIGMEAVAGFAREELLREAAAEMAPRSDGRGDAMLELKPERLAFGDFQDQDISVCGKMFRADMSGALYWPGEDALIVADLHLEKGSSLREARPARAAVRHARDAAEAGRPPSIAIDAGTVIALGDSLHDVEAAGPHRPGGAARSCASCRTTASGSG